MHSLTQPKTLEVILLLIYGDACAAYLAKITSSTEVKCTVDEPGDKKPILYDIKDKDNSSPTSQSIICKSCS